MGISFTMGDPSGSFLSFKTKATSCPLGWDGGLQVILTLVLLMGWMLVISGGFGSPLAAVRIGALSFEKNGGKSYARIHPTRN